MTLLFFLRTAKFSQLRARTLVENYAKAITNFPHWFRDIDTHKPDLIEAIDRGYELCISTASGGGCRLRQLVVTPVRHVLEDLHITVIVLFLL